MRDKGTTPPAIQLTEVTKRYGKLEALGNVTLGVSRGEVFALLGPNGAGKTTALEMLEGYSTPDSGQVEILGLDPRKRRRELAPYVGVMLQEAGVYPSIRVREAVSLFASYYTNPLNQNELLHSVGLADHRRTIVRRMSTGERQRLSLALALIGRPRVLLLDEPTAALDPWARSEVWDRLKLLSSEGSTVLFSTQLLEEAERHADRVAILDRGQLRAMGRPVELGQPTNRIEFSTNREVSAADLGHTISCNVEVVAGTKYVIRTRATPELIKRLAEALAQQGVQLVWLDSGSASLEETYMRLTRQ